MIKKLCKMKKINVKMNEKIIFEEMFMFIKDT